MEYESKCPILKEGEHTEWHSGDVYCDILGECPFIKDNFGREINIDYLGEGNVTMHKCLSKGLIVKVESQSVVQPEPAMAVAAA